MNRYCSKIWKDKYCEIVIRNLRFSIQTHLDKDNKQKDEQNTISRNKETHEQKN